MLSTRIKEDLLRGYESMESVATDEAQTLCARCVLSIVPCSMTLHSSGLDSSNGSSTARRILALCYTDYDLLLRTSAHVRPVFEGDTELESGPLTLNGNVTTQPPFDPVNYRSVTSPMPICPSQVTLPGSFTAHPILLLLFTQRSPTSQRFAKRPSKPSQPFIPLSSRSLPSTPCDETLGMLSSFETSYSSEKNQREA